MKDLFSGHASTYAAFRPVYPKEVYDSIYGYTGASTIAWDCATGNGQVAQELCKHFDKVIATDSSQQQLDHAAKRENIQYLCCPAESTPFESKKFELITVAQALHWFNTSLFFEEVKRVIKPGGVLAIWNYGAPKVEERIDALYDYFYTEIVGHYWDDARRLVETNYNTIHFPFKGMIKKEFAMTLRWNANHYLGYLRSWSATQKYIQTNGVDPTQALIELINPLWKSTEEKQVVFPIHLKLMQVESC